MDTALERIESSCAVFAGLMKERLEANKHKGYWGDCSIAYLLIRLEEEVAELRAAIRDSDIKAVTRQAANIANFCMMIAENAESEA
jgi:NTP pyrophosphatase (non-canonical NTP hydrolase)